MKAGSIPLLKLLQNAPQFIIPIYQRKYSWEIEQCQQLWNDIVNAGRSGNSYEHFFGAIVYVADHVLHDSPLLVIDGQQRLTTISLLLLALARKLGKDRVCEGLSEAKIRGYYLINPLETGGKHYKLLLTEDDKDNLIFLINGLAELKNVFEHSKLNKNFLWFMDKLSAADNNTLEEVCRGITKLLIVEVGLSRTEDNPQLVFESMNSTGLQLTQSDLIRNYILMGLEPDLQVRLYTKYWHPMEELFQGDISRFNSFVRHYLTLKNRSIPKEDELYKEFKLYRWKRAEMDKLTIENIVSNMYDYSKYYAAMVFEKDQENRKLSKNLKALKYAFKDIAALDIEVVYPFLLKLYSDWERGIISEKELLECLRLTESYIFRRAVCSIPTNSLSKTFATLGYEIDESNYVESLRKAYLAMPPYKRFPNNEEFKQSFVVRDLYNFRLCPYWLRRLENDGREEPVKTDDYSVEHIMPQTLTESWKKALGDNWAVIHEELLNTAGNLTLTGYNAAFSNADFIVKRDLEDKDKEKCGFRYSPLRLNERLRNRDEWNGDEIKECSRILADKAVRVWSLS